MTSDASVVAKPPCDSNFANYKLPAAESAPFPQMGPPMGRVGASHAGIATSPCGCRFSDLAFCKRSRFAAKHPSQNAHKLGFRHPIGGPICGKVGVSVARRSADAWIFVVAEQAIVWVARMRSLRDANRASICLQLRLHDLFRALRNRAWLIMRCMDEKRTSKEALANAWCWSFASKQDREYHDTEWGVPVHDDRQMFEHLCLESLQCGLSWDYVLQRRHLFRACFCSFDIDAVAAMNEGDIQVVLATPGILRNAGKMHAIVGNAQCAQVLRREFGSLSAYFWSWTDGKTYLYQGHQKGGIPASNGLSARIAKDLKRRGFKYVGPVTIYAHLQSCGIVCDHHKACPRYEFITQNYPCVRKRRDADAR